MASLLFEDIVEVSRDDAKQSLLYLLTDVGFAATAWQPFSNPALIVELSAEQRVVASQIAVALKNSFMSETAEGNALTQLSRSFYANDREPAVTSQHLITLQCSPTQGPHPIDLGELTFEHTDGATFRNVEGNSIVYPATLSSGGTITLLIEAEVAGQAANILDAFTPDTTTISLQTTLAGVTVVSHTLERSGLDEETDERLTERNQTKWATLSRFALIDEGIQAEVLRVLPSVTSVAVDATNPRGIGTFDVYIAGLDATASATDVANAQVAVDRLTMGRKNPMGKTAKVYASPEVGVDITGTVYFSSGSPAVIQAAVNTALIDYVRSIPPGGWSYDNGPQNIIPKNDLESIIRDTVLSNGATKCTVLLTVPTGDTTVGEYGKAVIGDWTGLTYSQSKNT